MWLPDVGVDQGCAYIRQGTSVCSGEQPEQFEFMFEACQGPRSLPLWAGSTVLRLTHFTVSCNARESDPDLDREISGSLDLGPRLMKHTHNFLNDEVADG